MQQAKIIFFLGSCLAKPYFCSKQNYQNKSKNVFTKHALSQNLFIKIVANQIKP
jgi:hypothetical protein